MMKRILKRVCLIPMALLILCSFGVCAAESGEPDYKVGLEIAFNHSEYVKGETATATIKLTELTDEKAAGAALGAVQVGLAYENIQPIESSFNFSDTVKNCLKSDDTSKFQKAEDSSKNLIILTFDCAGGVALNDETVDKDGKLTLGTVQFIVQTDIGKTVSLKLMKDLTPVVTNKFVGSKYSEFEFDPTLTTEETADVVGAVLEPGTAKLENNTVKTEGLRVAASYNKGILIAQLYDKNTGLTKATQAISDLSKASVSFDVSKIDKSNLKVRYYLWDSFLGMKALAESKAAEVK